MIMIFLQLFKLLAARSMFCSQLLVIQKCIVLIKQSKEMRQACNVANVSTDFELYLVE
jgi:hypothetical protein